VLTRVAVIDCVRVSGRARGERRWGRGWLVRGVVAACGLFVSGLLLKHCGGVFWLVWSFCFALPALHCTVLHCPTRRSLSMCASAPPIYLSAPPCFPGVLWRTAREEHHHTDFYLFLAAHLRGSEGWGMHSFHPFFSVVCLAVALALAVVLRVECRSVSSWGRLCGLVCCGLVRCGGTRQMLALAKRRRETQGVVGSR
jgi:hypothetical protein